MTKRQNECIYTLVPDLLGLAKRCCCHETSVMLGMIRVADGGTGKVEITLRELAKLIDLEEENVTKALGKLALSGTIEQLQQNKQSGTIACKIPNLPMPYIEVTPFKEQA